MSTLIDRYVEIGNIKDARKLCMRAAQHCEFLHLYEKAEAFYRRALALPLRQGSFDALNNVRVHMVLVNMYHRQGLKEEVRAEMGVCAQAAKNFAADLERMVAA